jgi:hypothetical protein
MMSGNDKSAVLEKIAAINEVEGFDPSALAVEYTDMNTGERRLRLPVMAQVAWFRLKYPEGKYTIDVTPGKDCFIAKARVYKSYMDPVDCFLSEASASRGYLPDKPTVSPREWAQTAALGIALRNAGFGLQFHAAGEAFDEPAVNELGQLVEKPNSVEDMPKEKQAFTPSVTVATESAEPETPTPRPAEDPLEDAMKMPCPIAKYRGKTLGDLITADPKALVWIAEKFTGDLDISNAAKLICEQSLVA